MFDETKHPRDDAGKFTYSDGNGGEHIPTVAENKRLEEIGVTDKKRIVNIAIDTNIQRQFDKATPKERSKIAYQYILDNLRGRYPTADGKSVLIERVGAKKISHTLFEPKIRVIPQLGELISAGTFIETKTVNHSKFAEFSYYDVDVRIGSESYHAVLNIGVRANGDSTLYEINQFEKI